jgi:hypothetical protein
MLRDVGWCLDTAAGKHISPILDSQAVHNDTYHFTILHKVTISLFMNFAKTMNNFTTQNAKPLTQSPISYT